MKPEDLSHEEQDNVIKLALEILSERYQTGTRLTSPHAVRTYLQLQLAERTREVFGAVFLDNKHRVLAFEELFYGTIDGTQVHPRIVVQRSLQLNAAAVIFVHNHPSGVAEPSRADENITLRLREALALIEVRVLDHFIVTAEGTLSLSERGVI
jgi:DNA repair protein RadC